MVLVSRRYPFLLLRLYPTGSLGGVTDQRGIWAFRLPEPYRQIRARNIVDLVRCRLEPQAAHNRRHMTRHAARPCRFLAVVRMRASKSARCQVALRAHPVRIVAKLQRHRIRPARIGRMRIVATGALRGAPPETSRAKKRLANERSLPEPPVLVKCARTEFPVWLAHQPIVIPLGARAAR